VDEPLRSDRGLLRICNGAVSGANWSPNGPRKVLAGYSRMEGLGPVGTEGLVALAENIPADDTSDARDRRPFCNDTALGPVLIW
jgi:hypothetical protein